MNRLNPDKLPSYCFKTTANGIPCIVEVVSFTPGVPANLSGHPDSWHPADPSEIEIALYDRKGYVAAWLERMLSEEQMADLEIEAEKYVTENDID